MVYQIYRDNTGAISSVNLVETGESIDYLVNEEFLAYAATEGLDLEVATPTIMDLELFKATKKAEIVSLAYAKQQSLVSDFAPPEQASWGRKVEESKKFIDGEDLDKLLMLKSEASALSGSQDLEVIKPFATSLATKILAKSDLMYAATAAISGERTRKCMAIDKANSVEEVLACL